MFLISISYQNNFSSQVTEVNKRWQRYNNDRQMYVQRLLSTIQEQQEQINKIGALSALTMREV